MPDEPVSRRTFLDRLLFTSVAAAGVAALAPIPFFLRPPESPRPPRIRMGKVGELFLKAPALDLVYGGRGATAMLDGGVIRVINRRCSHQGCDVNLSRRDWRFECPCHGAIFASDGAPIRGPHNGPLATIPHRIVDGELEVGE
ncbi:MAG TPA: Rieske 2Fe-2S domain-containing protein [Candidatus Krumholzibacteria bacterium]|nr:Rieske 2Fe-2S domain-containing protein [Candidatus Krumholzibacteria bacterium]